MRKPVKWNVLQIPGASGIMMMLIYGLFVLAMILAAATSFAAMLGIQAAFTMWVGLVALTFVLGCLCLFQHVTTLRRTSSPSSDPPHAS